MAQVNIVEYMEWCEASGLEPSRATRAQFEAERSVGQQRRNYQARTATLVCLVAGGAEVFLTSTCEYRDRFDAAVALEWRAQKEGHDDAVVHVLGERVDISKIATT